MAYSAPFKGYVADVPEVFFKRIDGKVFHYDKITQASATPQVNFTEVQAGWGLYPVAYLPAASTMEIQLTSGQFDSSLFAMANGSDFAADATYKFPKHQTIYATGGSATLTVSGTVVASDIKIEGMSQGTTPSGKAVYKVAVSESTATFTFATGDGCFANTDPIEVYWEETRTNALSLDVTNTQAAIGEAIMKWPVYNGGENVSTDSFNGASIKGHILMRIYRCRATQMPGFDTSYKSAATNSVTFSTMDPDNAANAPVKADGTKAAYTLTYVENK